MELNDMIKKLIKDIEKLAEEEENSDNLIERVQKLLTIKFQAKQLIHFIKHHDVIYPKEVKK